MASKAPELDLSPMDTKDVDRWIGVPLAGAQLKEPITVNDIRRWAQGMQNPNRLYYDEAYAAQERVRRNRRAPILYGLLHRGTRGPAGDPG